MRWNLRINLCLAALVMFALPLVWGAEKKKDPQVEAEEKQAAEEDSAAVGKDTLTGYEFNSRGKLYINEVPDGQKPLVLGTFVADGKIYQIKVEREELRAQLAPYHNKEVGLAGKIRNGGKYLVVQNIMGGVPPPDVIRNRRGL
jgi:hypothetical protein